MKIKTGSNSGEHSHEYPNDFEFINDKNMYYFRLPFLASKTYPVKNKWDGMRDNFIRDTISEMLINHQTT